MPDKQIIKISWNTFSCLLLAILSFLQLLRWQLFPQFMDMHYHLLIAREFLDHAGYCGWDYLQYAPVGRPHIYPPLFHVLLALLLKAGLGKIFLAKLFEAITPSLFLLPLWFFVKKNYSPRLAFFVLLISLSSFSFFLSLINNVPATFALILGLFALDRLLQGSYRQAAFSLILCFYTHIGVSWFISLTFFLFALFDPGKRRQGLWLWVLALIVSAPVIYKQISASAVISLSGINERFFCEFKPVEYILGLYGLFIIFKREKKSRIFAYLFLASFIFLFYPYRLFSAQGFLPIIFLAGITLNFIYERLKGVKKKIYLFCAITVILIFSPTFLMEGKSKAGKSKIKLYVCDSALMDLAIVGRNDRVASESLWFADEYLLTADLIRRHTQPDDIIYSDLDYLGVCLANLSGRATANALLPEVPASGRFDPFVVSKILLISYDFNRGQLQDIVRRYNFVKIGENGIFAVYFSPSCRVKAAIPG